MNISTANRNQQGWVINGSSQVLGFYVSGYASLTCTGIKVNNGVPYGETFVPDSNTALTELTKGADGYGYSGDSLVTIDTDYVFQIGDEGQITIILRD